MSNIKFVFRVIYIYGGQSWHSGQFSVDSFEKALEEFVRSGVHYDEVSRVAKISLIGLPYEAMEGYNGKLSGVIVGGIQ